MDWHAERTESHRVQRTMDGGRMVGAEFTEVMGGRLQKGFVNQGKG